MSSGILVKQEFLKQLDTVSGFQNLFEHVPDLSFWVKDANGHFVMGNQSTAQLCGCRHEQDLLGRTDFDFWPKDVADSFASDDFEVLQTGKEIVDRIETIPGRDGAIRWYSTIKVPLFGQQGSVIGVAGTARCVRKSESVPHPEMEFSDVIEYVSQHYSESIEVRNLAQMASLSVSQFERRFKKVYKETPAQFIIKVRINAVCRALVQTRNPIRTIADSTGFFDQSYLSKQFVKRMGMTPRKFRESYFQGQA